MEANAAVEILLGSIELEVLKYTTNIEDEDSSSPRKICDALQKKNMRQLCC